jgi:hypothetical protein
METYQVYNDYGITYYSISGTTEVDDLGFVMKRFVGLGEAKGIEAAKNFIDSLC